MPLSPSNSCQPTQTVSTFPYFFNPWCIWGSDSFNSGFWFIHFSFYLQKSNSKWIRQKCVFFLAQTWKCSGSSSYMEIVYLPHRKRVNSLSESLEHCPFVLMSYLDNYEKLEICLFIFYICFLLCFAIERQKGSPRTLHMKYITDPSNRQGLSKPA